MKIGLYGIYGVYNFGCEAIVRGAVKLIHDLYPSAEIIYFTYNFEYDRNVLKDIDLEVRPIKQKRSLLKRVINKFFLMINSEKRMFYFDYNKIIESVDMFFSIGGDIYTIPEVLRKKRKYPYYNSLVYFCNKAIASGKDVIVYGASIGPFGEFQNAIDYYKENLNKYKIIICREDISINYLKKIGINNTCLFPDPAFQIKSEITESIAPIYIGINFSPLSVLEIYGNYGEDNCKKFARLIDRIYESTGKELLFIPHVLSSNEKDNDYLFMKNIHLKMDSKNQPHVHFANYNNGFIGLKPQLKQCYLVMASRMHCAINAIDENIPAIFLSYSQKSIGMCEFVYHSKEWLIDLKNVEEEALSKIQYLLENRCEIIQKIKKRNKEIETFYLENLNSIKGFLRERNEGNDNC